MRATLELGVAAQNPGHLRSIPSVSSGKRDGWGPARAAGRGRIRPPTRGAAGHGSGTSSTVERAGASGEGAEGRTKSGARSGGRELGGGGGEAEERREEPAPAGARGRWRRGLSVAGERARGERQREGREHGVR